MPPKKRNQTDTTLRNNRARVKEIAALRKRVAALEAWKREAKPLRAKLKRLLSC